MKINVILTSTLPSKGKHFWQTVIFPTASVYKETGYTSINLEWLFWLITIIIEHNGQVPLSVNEK